MSLAIVLPAFKARFLRSALQSLASQTDRDFTLYVADDASPDNIDSVCAEFGRQLRIVYHRFRTNLGNTSLPRHWNRCVDLTKEEWIWLFSDDDVAEKRCVEAFRHAVAALEPSVDIYRFPVGIIDREGNTIFELTRYAPIQSWLDFARARLEYAQMSFVVDKIFSRSAFEREGGFVDFPYAWCSDDASWIAFAGTAGIREIEGGGVFWRWSDANLSATSAPIQREKIVASIMFLEWLNGRMRYAGVTEDECRAVRVRYEGWFYRQLFSLKPNFGFMDLFHYGFRLARASGSSVLIALLILVRSRLAGNLAREWPAFDERH